MLMPARPPARARTVLLVDDAEEFLEVAGRLLDGDGRLTVVGGAQSGAEAVDLAARLSPDVVVVALLMPDATGLVTARRLHEVSPAAMVLLVTASDPAPYQAAAEALGLSPIISKRDLTVDTVLDRLDQA